MRLPTSTAVLLATIGANCDARPLEEPAQASNNAQLIPRNSLTGNCTYQWFVQKLDHFGQHNGTFPQRYDIETKYFKPDGPIFYYQGEETGELDCVNNAIYENWAEETNGLAVILEHRYFGKSKPFNATNPVKQKEEFSYLTLENVVTDAGHFVDSLKKNISGAEDSKVIVSSGK